MRRYIHIEGLDLSGKTSVTNEIVNMRLDEGEEWVVRHRTLSDERNELQYIADKMCGQRKHSELEVGLTYVAALRFDLDNFKYPEVNTIQESTVLLRSLAYHAIRGNSKVVAELEDMAALHPKFEQSYLLTARPEIRLARLATRASNSHNDLLIVRDPKRFARIEDKIEEYSQELFGSEIIDTSDMSTQEAAEYINGNITTERRGDEAKAS